MDQNTALPARPDELTKMTQANSLAAIVPQIMNAIGGGDQRTQQLLAQQQQGNAEMLEKQKEQMFMRSIMSPDTGEITPELIMKTATLFGVPQEKAFNAVVKFDAFGKAKKAEQEQKQGTIMGLALMRDPEKMRQFLNGMIIPGEGEYKDVSPGSMAYGAKMASEFNSVLPKPQLAESYNPDGTASFIEKKEGATFNPKPKEENLQRIPDGKGGFKFVKPVEGMTGMENPSKSSEFPFAQGAMGIIDKRTGEIVQQPDADIDMDALTPDEIDTLGASYNLTGKLPALGIGKKAASIKTQILKSATRQLLGKKAEGKTPMQAALDGLEQQSDTKAIQGSLNFLDKQMSSMGSFVSNLNMQVDKVKELSKDLETFDTRLLNIPLRTLRGKVAGSPLQAKYDMYLAEIESEIGKLATGSTASIAELSATAQERWSKIHDKNLSVKDMLALLDETKNAANMRYQSVETQLEKTRGRMVNREGGETEQPAKEQPKNNDPLGIR